MTRFGLFFCLLTAAVFAGLGINQYLTEPLETPGESRIISIPQGHSFARIAADLEREGVIDNALLFRLLGRITRSAHSAQAGEFHINTGWNRLQLLDTLVHGREVLHPVQVPEGSTWWETARIVDQSGLTTFERFAAAVHNATLLEEYGIPARSAEGYLFPETYALPRPRGGSAMPVIRAMLDEFLRRTRGTLQGEESPSPERVHELVILASLVEKETAREGERARIAGVYANRLKRGMRLQCDPTVIYGLGPDFDGNLTRKDLRDSSNEYNTYRHGGLPPGPICSPGLASLEAARDPEEHGYLYFVATGDGGHHFSRTLKEHNRAVRTYQLQ
jgi:UPF0755 protein